MGPFLNPKELIKTWSLTVQGLVIKEDDSCKRIRKIILEKLS